MSGVLNIAELLGIQQQLNDMNEKIRENKNAILSNDSDIANLSEIVNQFSGALNFSGKFYIDKNHQIAFKGLQGMIDVLGSQNNNPLVTLKNMIDGVRSEIENEISNYYSQLKKYLDGFSDLLYNEDFDVYYSKEGKISVTGVKGLMDALSGTSNNPFVYLESLLNAKFSLFLSANRQFQYNQPSVSYSEHQLNVSQTRVNGSFTFNSIGDALSGIYNKLNADISDMITELNKALGDLWDQFQDIGSNFGKIINLANNNDGLGYFYSQLNSLYSQLTSMNTASLSIGKDYSNLVDVLTAIKNGNANFTNAINFKDLLGIKTAWYTYLKDFGINYPSRVSDFYKKGLFGFPISTYKKPRLYIYITDGASWNFSKDYRTYTPITDLLSHVSTIIMGRINSMISSSNLAHIQRQIGLISHTINGVLYVLQKIGSGNHSATYYKDFHTSDDVYASVTIEISDMYFEGITSLFDDFAYPILNNHAGGVNRLKNAFSTIFNTAPDSWLPSIGLNFNIDNSKLQNPFDISFTGNIIQQIEELKSYVESEISQLRDQVNKIKNTLNSLSVMQ